MPADAYQAQGPFGQYVVIVPSRRLVVVRLGQSPSGGDIEGLAKLVAATVAAIDAPPAASEHCTER
jgi:CubicO group peptidase (beta-lactamase class C family)